MLSNYSVFLITMDTNLLHLTIENLGKNLSINEEYNFLQKKMLKLVENYFF